MPTPVHLLVHSAKQLITCASPVPKRGAALRDLGLIEDGALAVHEGRIVAVGKSDALRAEYVVERSFNASGKVVCPGFVDCHTHLVYGGDRLHDFELRLHGASYLDILAAGGGILSTVKATRAATVEQLTTEAIQRLEEMLRLGTTTVEIKTGYGLDTHTELKMLEVIAALAQTQPADIIPTFLGAHALPPEYRGWSDDYIELVISEMLPSVVQWYQQSRFAAQGKPCYVDVFCEAGVFTAAQTKRVLTAGKTAGLGVKAHVDEFQALGGVAVGVELGATSLDHLDVTDHEDIPLLADSETIAVLLPAVNFHLGSKHYAKGRALVEAGAAVAIATDLNPGSAPCPSMPLVMALACRYNHLLPAEALNASTINAAFAIGMGQHVGSLEVGKQADFLILHTPDYRSLMQSFGGNPVESVFKRGKMV